MEIQKRELIKQTIKDTESLASSFFQYKLSTNQSLFQIQASYSQTITTICITLIAVGVGGDIIRFNTLLSISVITLPFLLFFSTSWVRESVDNTANSLNKEEAFIKETNREVATKAIEALEKDDDKIFFDFVRGKINHNIESTELMYAGELFHFLLYFGIGTGLMAVSKFSEAVPTLITVSWLIIASGLLAFRDWGTDLVKRVSQMINKARLMFF